MSGSPLQQILWVSLIILAWLFILAIGLSLGQELGWIDIGS